MSINSIGKISSKKLRILAKAVSSIQEANMILQNPKCDEETRQIVLDVVQSFTSDKLDAGAHNFNKAGEANLILSHNKCSEKIGQKVVAKLYLLDDSELQSIPQDYHFKIHEVAQQKFGDPTATATG